MFNDATALVAYKVAVAAAVTGAVSYGGAGLEPRARHRARLGVGLRRVGWLAQLVLAVVHDGYAETTLTVLVPFVAYIGAEQRARLRACSRSSRSGSTCAPTGTPPRPRRAGCSAGRCGPTPTS